HTHMQDFLLRSDRAPYSSENGKTKLTMGNQAWITDKHEGGDIEGWLYAASWKGPWFNQQDKSHTVRRRKWVIKKKLTSSQVSTGSAPLSLSGSTAVRPNSNIK